MWGTAYFIGGNQNEIREDKMLIITYISACILFLVSFYMYIGLSEVIGDK